MNIENEAVDMSPEEGDAILSLVVEDEMTHSGGEMDYEEDADDGPEEFDDADFGGQGDTLRSIKFSADSITNSEVEKDMDDMIEKVKQFVPPEVSLDTVKLILDQNGWDSEKSITTLSTYENGVEGYCAKSYIPFPNGTSNPSFFVAENAICTICTSSVTEYHTHGDCNSIICLVCWQEYIRTCVTEDGRTCMTCPVCPMFLENRLVQELATDSTVVDRLTANNCNKFIQTSKHHVSCPAPDCKFIFRSKLPIKSYSGWKSALCRCGSLTCLECLSLGHGPLSCESLKVWLTLHNVSDILSNQWILANSKPCPKCSTNIQKNGGCNWMTCTNRGCGICLQKAHNHSHGETCTRFYRTQTPPLPGQVVNAIHRRERYGFYGERYHNMITGGHFSQVQTLNMEQARRDFQQLSIGEVDIKLLDDLPSLLKQARSTLAHSYGLIYLLADSVERTLFEDNLTFLQAKVDGLEWYLHYQMHIESAKEINDYLRVNMEFCRNRINIMNTTSEKNYNERKWEFDYEEPIATPVKSRLQQYCVIV
ncbi:E3 ubiquitin-protein ligase arih1 [Folsomia candida]|uniref:RBR-type E3 ubiquitin transferase n=1 Tax=Folsomia candida TaxID=158441 RepID=A0A226DZ41_FOLCA|nr:E3 ubiquitin-protein ligase arih1 [Folsomia candida]